jgi:sugar phosphate isomerase/epimerase
MKISVITNGISQDYETCCRIMNDTKVHFAEIQEVYGMRVERISLDDAQKIAKLDEKYQIGVSCITTHAFVGIPVASIEVDDERYQNEMALLLNAFKVAKIVKSPLVRCMCFAKQSVMDGYNGADQWVAGNNKAWPKLLQLYAPIVRAAEEHGVQIVVENGFNGMLTGSYSCKRFMKDITNKNVSILWDPANAINVCDEIFPESYDEIKQYIKHIHIKDILVNVRESWVKVVPIGRGMMAPYLERLANALREDGYDGFVSLENILRPDNKDFLDGYRIDIPTLISIFGD